jgi:hypothetical protein
MIEKHIKYSDTILYDKRRRSAGVCKGKARSKKLMRTQNKVESLHNYYSHRIAQSMEYDKRKVKADTQREKRREQRRARKIAKAQHMHMPTFKMETWEIGRQVRRTER